MCREHRRGEEGVVALAEVRERPLPEPEQSDPAIRQPRHPPRPGIVRSTAAGGSSSPSATATTLTDSHRARCRLYPHPA